MNEKVRTLEQLRTQVLEAVIFLGKCPVPTKPLTLVLFQRPLLKNEKLRSPPRASLHMISCSFFLSTSSTAKFFHSGMLTILN